MAIRGLEGGFICPGGRSSFASELLFLPIVGLGGLIVSAPFSPLVAWVSGVWR